jgi:hypothetical protein
MATADDLPLSTGEGEAAAAQLRFGEHARLLLDVDRSHLGTLLDDASPAMVTLRLEDEFAARSASTFELSWRLWLRAWNLLQGLPGAALATRESAQPAGVSRSAQPSSVAPPPADLTLDARRLAAIGEVTDEAAVAALTELLGRYPDLEAPAVPFELRPPDYALTGDVELGWPARKVAAYFEREIAAAEALRAAGWAVLAIERGLTADAMARALRLGERN